MRVPYTLLIETVALYAVEVVALAVVGLVVKRNLWPR